MSAYAFEHARQAPMGLRLPSIHSLHAAPPPDPDPFRAPSPASIAAPAAAETVPGCINCGTTTTPMWRRAPQGSPLCNACGLKLAKAAANTARPPPPPITLDPVLAGLTARSTSPSTSKSLYAPASEIGPDPSSISSKRRTEPPVGSCPGDGVCNGQGGKSCCSGCPAFNNKHPAASPQPPGDGDSAVGEQTGDGSGVVAMSCDNCGTQTTPLWRRDGNGKVACNACGLYFKLHGKHRPSDLKRPTIKRRKRVPNSGKPDADDSGEAVPEVVKPTKRRKRAAPSPPTVSTPNDAAEALLAVSGNTDYQQGSPRLPQPNGYPFPVDSTPLLLPDLARIASDMAHMDQPAVACAGIEDLHRFRAGLAEVLGQTRQHMSALGAFLTRGEALLAACDKSLQDGTESTASDREPDAFYERIEALPVQAALPLRGRGIGNGAA